MESLLLKQIDEAATHNEVLVMGDFNYPDINWETETCETHKGNRGTCQGVTKTLNFRKAKFDQLRDALNLVDWDNILRNENTDNKWEMFKNILNRQCKRFIPCGNKRTRNRKNPMWLNKEVRQAINSKKKAFALLKQDGTIEALKNYREKNTLSKKLIKAAKKETEKHIAKESKTNPKLFFNYINSKRIKTENVGPLKNSEERMVVDDEEKKANILNTFFSTVFTVENEMLGEIPRNNENPILRVTNLTQEEVRNRLNKIKIDKSPGPDGIHPRVLRELNDSIATGSVPQDWRIANVVPIFKKGSKSEPGNYRPLNDGVTAGQGLGVEIMVTFQLVLCVVAVTDRRRRDISGSVPLAIGLSVALGHLIAIDYTGCGMNPARSFGSAVIAKNFQYHWIFSLFFWVGPMIGGAAAAIIYDFILAPRTSDLTDRLKVWTNGQVEEYELDGDDNARMEMKPK
ncbi:unnamed protein product [Ranitomeya imitator]|uniref:Uncharacterized protein n=1 Tax=Ranitomeya imitator TaxID=111125 RepID=A0ABN9KYK7_9NEOB|nr:unnamed protein product [Ranitomeya imitator]